MKRHSYVVSILVLLLVLGQFGAPQAFSASVSNGLLKQMSDEIANVVERVRPAVVSVQSTSIKKMEDPFEPFEQMFGPQFRERFAPQMPKEQEYRQQGLGSGFIIDPSGIILTNNHVVADMDNIKVMMNDGREFKAKVLGADPDSEVAVIKIDATNLPTLELGNSDDLKIGNFVIAIGSPLGIEFRQTVTLGIVSALKRAVGITSYDSFIQTDAAINLGNSGGPLIDVDGNVVGINTAIVSRTGGSEGLGLAIPINDARKVADVLRKGGKMQRGYLGLQGSDLTADAATYLGAEDQTGLIITMVMPGTPADKAGLKAQDAVVGLNGEKIANYSEFRNKVAALAPGDKVNLKVYRNKKQMDVTATLAQRPSRKELIAESNGGAPTQEKPEKIDLGFSVQKLTPKTAEALGYQGKKGVLVTEVDPSSDAGREGLAPKMLITEINNKKVETVEQAKKAIEAGKKMDKVYLLVETQKGSTQLIIVPRD